MPTCSIEKHILENNDLNIVLVDFASRNARRSYLFLEILELYVILGECPCVATEPYNNTITYVHMCVILL
jgi:hypothetical protein